MINRLRFALNSQPNEEGGPRRRANADEALRRPLKAAGDDDVEQSTEAR